MRRFSLIFSTTWLRLFLNSAWKFIRRLPALTSGQIPICCQAT